MSVSVTIAMVGVLKSSLVQPLDEGNMVRELGLIAAITGVQTLVM